jgi:hypothetical protein
VTASILSGMALPDGARELLLLIVPLFVAGLCMAVFLLPRFDEMAKRDLATIRAQRAAESEAGPDEDEPAAG